MNGNNVIVLGSHDHKEFAVNSIKLNGCKGANINTNSYSSLCENSIELCEFCDKVSKNRYSSIIHNARHIIIPLLKQEIHQCLECLHHFTSDNSLNRHILLKHRKITKSKQILVNAEPIDVDNYEPKHNKHNTISLNDDCNILNQDSKIQNRLVFEEDTTESEMLMDLTNECKVNIELFEAPWFEIDLEFDGKSVGFDELMRPGVYKCKKCWKMFPNRYDAITHETKHIKFKNYGIQLCPSCNTYVPGDAGDLYRHTTSIHSLKCITKCHKCGATYSDIEKHKIYCPMNRVDRCDSKMDFKERSKVIDLCAMCLKFCKSTPLKQYVCVGVRSMSGKRFPCERCGVLFFEVKMVERRIRYREKEKDEKKRKALSNEDRLKHIKQRLKMLK